jgi:hypothetical protein
VNAATVRLSPAPACAITSPQLDTTIELERAVDYVLDDCFFTVGQVVGMRKTLEYEAVVWWRDHYRARFLAAMRRFGDRWRCDRDNVTGVAFMLAERAVRHAGEATVIDIACARRAAAEVERYCQLHSRRAARAGASHGDDVPPRVAGYWCVPGNPGPDGD